MKNVCLISNAGDPHCDYLISACKELNVNYFRYNTEKFRLDGDFFWNPIKKESLLRIDNRECRLEEIDLLIYRRPIKAYVGRNDKPNWLLELLDFEWNSLETALSGAIRGICISPIGGLSQARNKLIQVQNALKVGMAVPEIIVTTNKQQLLTFAKQQPCITKAIESGGSIDGKLLRSSHTQIVDYSTLSKYEPLGCPTLLQQRIETKATWRIVTIGDKTFGFRHTGIQLQEEIDSRKIEDKLEGYQVEVPTKIHDQLQNLCQNLGINFASSDFLEDQNGKMWFIDLNPEGQWAFLEELYKVKLSHEIIKLAFKG